MSGYVWSGDDGLTTKVEEYSDNAGSWQLHRIRYKDMRELGGVPYLIYDVVAAPSPDGRVWVHGYEYDSEHNISTQSYPSRFNASAYSPATTTTAPNVSDDGTGYKLKFEYTADNRLAKTYVFDDTLSSPSFSLITETTYPTTGRIWLPTETIRYRKPSADGSTGLAASDKEVTQYAYFFFDATDDRVASDDALSAVEVSQEAETDAENGPGNVEEYKTYELYDRLGRNSWSVSADNSLTYRAFDPNTGEVTARVRNAARVAPGGDDRAGFAASGHGSLEDSPSIHSDWGWQSDEYSVKQPLPGGELAEFYGVDPLGRVRSHTSPGGVSVYTRRELRADELHPGILYFSTVVLPHDLGTGDTIDLSTYVADADYDRNGTIDSIDEATYTLQDGRVPLPAGWISDPADVRGTGDPRGPDDSIGFAGAVFDPPTGMYMMRHRVYSPRWGRFLQRDRSGYIDGTNLYEYVRSDPANRLDPMGLDSTWLSGVTGLRGTWVGNWIDNSYEGAESALSGENIGASYVYDVGAGVADTWDRIAGNPYAEENEWIEHTENVARRAIARHIASGGCGSIAGAMSISTDHDLGAELHSVRTELAFAAYSTAATLVPAGTAAKYASRSVGSGAVRAIPTRMARVMPEGTPLRSLGRPGDPDVFVTAADDIAGMNARQIARRLGIPRSDAGYTIVEFRTPATGVATPVFRSNPGFVGKGLTSGGAREFVIPNGRIPPNAVVRRVPWK